MNFNSGLEFQFIYILDNAVLAWGLAACGLAQFSKLLFELVFKQNWRPVSYTHLTLPTKA